MGAHEPDKFIKPLFLDLAALLHRHILCNQLKFSSTHHVVSQFLRGHTIPKEDILSIQCQCSKTF